MKVIKRKVLVLFSREKVFKLNSKCSEQGRRESGEREEPGTEVKGENKNLRAQRKESEAAQWPKMGH